MYELIISLDIAFTRFQHHFTGKFMQQQGKFYPFIGLLSCRLKLAIRMPAKAARSDIATAPSCICGLFPVCAGTVGAEIPVVAFQVFDHVAT